MTKLGLAVFCKAPVEGQCKTRLIADLGAEGALQVHIRLARETLARLGSVAEQRVLWCSAESPLARTWAMEFGYEFEVQRGANLGQRMHHALAAMLAAGCSAVCLVGSDCPPIGSDYLHSAFVALDGADAIFGPAEDGGYGLVGLSEARCELFDDMRWGENSVMASTRVRATEHNLKIYELPKIWDVDTLEDWQRYLSGADARLMHD